MLLQDKETGNLVEVNDLQALLSPNEATVKVQVQEGEEEQDPEALKKSNLIFPSGESLPRCWVDAEYRK
ncbi:MAG: acetyltransferase [Calothrix sp. C42_A2020_038]|nr:acetyltransferase [Calothrix sp. C42_A2020_038]